MLQRDYLMNLILQFVRSIVMSLEKGKKDPVLAAENLEDAISQATDVDKDVLFPLDGMSFAMILQVSSLDPVVVSYVCQSLLLEARYLDDAQLGAKAALRRSQAEALADAYGVELIDTDDFLNQEEFQSSKV